MKRAASILCYMLLCLSIFAEGKVSWLRTTYDFGTFKEETGKVTCDIKMINTGDSAILITNVRPTCGCTASSYTRNAIAPGDTATVTLTYNPKGRPGRFEKNVYVYTSGTPQKSILTIKGNVIGSPATIMEKYPISAGGLKLSNRIIPFGEITKGKSRTQFINVYNQSEDTLTAEFSNLPKHIDAEMIPTAVNPGESATITVTFHSADCDEWGLTQDGFVMETIPAGGASANATAGIMNIDVTSILQENFSRLSDEEKSQAPAAKLLTQKVDFGKINADDKVATGSFKIFNTGKSKLKIRRIYTLDEGVEIACKKKEIKPGKTMEVKVTVYPEKTGKILNAKLLVITNDPANPQQMVRLVGQITANDNN